MTNTSSQGITRLLTDWCAGDQAALEQLAALIYDELRRLAHRRLLHERPGHTLQTTALVNEAYMLLIDQHEVSWQNRAHFFAVAARLMRRILVDYARSRHYAKRAGEERKVGLEEAAEVSADSGAELIAVDDALESLAVFDERKSRVVELRFFGGLTIEETAEALQISHATVEREWTAARAWLYRELARN